MNKQIITQGGKPAFVVIPFDEWKRIEAAIEERIDAAVVRAFAVRPEEVFPDRVVAEILGGVSPIKAFRKYRGLTQGGLARKAATNSVYLSQIERGERQAGRKLLAKLARILSVPPELLTRA